MFRTTVLPGTPCAPPHPGDVPLHRLETAGPGATPFAAGDFDALGPLARGRGPHRHTFYEIVHVTAGTGTHVIDLARWTLNPPHLAVIRPGQVHHWESDRNLTGTLVLFTEDFLVDHPGDRAVLRRLAERSWFSLDAEQNARIGLLADELVQEHRERSPGYESVLRSLLHVLVTRADRLPERGTGPHRAEGRMGAVAEAFARMLADRREAPASIERDWIVRECARRLGVTPGYLTEAVRAATGRSPGRLLIEARAQQAQRLLAHTGLSVRQIADRTGFADPAYFSRFFRRETGSSPGAFRKHHSHHHQSLEAPRRRP